MEKHRGTVKFKYESALPWQYSMGILCIKGRNTDVYGLCCVSWCETTNMSNMLRRARRGGFPVFCGCRVLSGIPLLRRLRAFS